jgi:hypothetical protein
MASAWWHFSKDRSARGRVWHVGPIPSRCYRPSLEGLETRSLPSGTGTAGQLQAAYGQLPLSFEANQGQADSRVQFLSRGQGYALFLTSTEAVLSLQQPPAPGARIMGPSQAPWDTVLRLQLAGGNPNPSIEGVNPLADTSNYFEGNDPRHWHTNIPTYAKVAYHDVYAGIDLVYYGNQQQLEYDFTVAPGADPNVIRLNVSGAQTMALDSQGNLVLSTAGGDVIEHAPVLYQDSAEGRQPISGRFVLEGAHQVGFAVGAYDRARPLVIDPKLAYSTYLGGSTSGFEFGSGIAVDAAGNAYVVGLTTSSDFPTTAGAFQTTLRSSQGNAFVTKLNAGGTALVYSTYLGGSEQDAGLRIAVNAAGNAYVTGGTSSSNFPTTTNAFQTRLGSIQGNAFVTKLSPSGASLVYSTYLGGSGSDTGTGIAVDAAGSAYVTGSTSSHNFPTTSGAFQATLRGSTNGFVTKLSPAGASLIYSTYIGGNASDFPSGLALDAAGDAYITGNTTSSNFPVTPGAFQTALLGGRAGNAFVAKLNAGGTALVYSTYLGGNGGNGGGDLGSGIAVDAAGNAYVTGSTASSNFPTTAGAFQKTLANSGGNAFVTKVNVGGTALVYSTFLGGTALDDGFGIAVDAVGDAYVAGQTSSPDFPTTAGAFQTKKAGTQNAFLTKLNPGGTALLYSTYLGGGNFDQGEAVAVDAAGSAYLTGETGSKDFPTTSGAFQRTLHANSTTNAFVAKFTFGPVRFFAVGGAPGRVLVYQTDNTLLADFAPLGAAYTDPINVAVGDVNGDGVPDLVTAAAAGNPDVRVFNGQAFANGTFDPNNPDASLITQWFPYGLEFNVGATVAVGDIEHNGFADIVTGANVGNPDVRVYRGKDIAMGTFNPTGSSLLAQWFPYDVDFNVGANVAVGDVNGDGFADVVTGTTAGNPDVRVYNGKDIAQGRFKPGGNSLLAQFFPYGLDFNVGAFVAVGDTTGSGFGDVITGASTGNPDVRVYSGKDIAHGTFDPAGSSQRDQFFAYGVDFGIGAAVASADFEGTGHFDILTGASAGAPHYRVVKGNATGTEPPAVFEGFAQDIQGGTAVGA